MSAAPRRGRLLLDRVGAQGCEPPLWLSLTVFGGASARAERAWTCRRVVAMAEDARAQSIADRYARTIRHLIA